LIFLGNAGGELCGAILFSGINGFELEAVMVSGFAEMQVARLEGELMNRYAVGHILRSILAAVVFTTFGVLPLAAQVDTGSITGIITDASGAVVSGAKVTLTNEGTGTSLSTNTGADGVFDFSPVRIGNYKLDVAAAGFKKAVQIHIAVDVSARVQANFKLDPGAVNETVEVTSAAPVLQSQDASVGQVVDQRSVNNLPLNGRNFTFLAQLAAGVNTPEADTRGNAASGAFTANGNRPAQNNYMLDGVDNNSDTVDFLNGTNFVVLPPVDAIQEFKVETSGFSAEYGRSGAAVLNATIKSGTNQFHGAVWEFFRNDKLDAPDYFEDAGGVPKGELRQNQFGATIGGPVIKNRVFFFGDYEGLRRIQGTILTGNVPTTAERNSGYTDFSDLISLQTSSGSLTDQLGRTMPYGTILDPATTRQVTANVQDPVSGITPTTAMLNGATTGFVRDPFGTCPASTLAFSLGGCGLNQISTGRLDPNAIKLLNLYPGPTNNSLFSNFANSPKLDEHRNAFDTRLDVNFSEKDQAFYRFSYVDDPQFIPGIFGGVADGGAFQQGNQTANAQQSALAYTHVFSPSLVNVARAGLNYLHTTRSGPVAGSLTNIPGQFGIQDIPQVKENGGLPAFGINGLSTLGSNAFLPSDEVSSTFQLTDDLTKIYGKHTFKMGFEWQHVKFSTLQPPWSHGEFDYNGNYTEIPSGAPGSNSDQGNTGRAAFLLTPVAATPGVGTVDFLGGSTNIDASNISLTDNGKNYYGTYFNDDWKISPKLTVNLGLRWDFFGLVYEHHGAQANFVPSGAPTGGPMYLLPGGTNPADLSSSFTTLLAADGIALDITNKYGKGLGNSQKSNFAPRVGFAYQATPKLVARGGFGMFYNGFENRGYSPNLGENYPFQFNFTYGQPNDWTPRTFPGCAAAGPGGTATFETGFACTPLVPTAVLANGLALRGIQFNYQTPYTMSGNFTLQYQLTPTMTVQAGYVTSLARHLEVFPGSNNPTAILPTGLSLTNTAGANGGPGSGAVPASQGGLPFPDFGGNNSYAATAGNSFYHGLQTKAEKRFASGLNFLVTYTYSKTRTDAVDLLNGGSNAGYRVPDVTGLGIHYDYGLADFDIRNVFHLSGEYQLPFGKGKRYFANGGAGSKILGGWSVNATGVLQGGQPITLTCPTNTVSTTAGSNCYDLIVAGQSPKRGLHIDSNGKLSFFGNPGAFSQPAPCTASPCPLSAVGGPPDQIAGPTFKRMDFSVFKNFQLTERFRMEFRSEFFNLLNHPNFNAPNFGGNGVVAVPNSGNFTSSSFGEIGSTRDAPYDPRQIQFALKLYY
jgi:Carboxypeptidase regulatory-like domain/TonB dependent receptor/TonB-dependent Receptor Plug Domain